MKGLEIGSPPRRHSGMLPAGIQNLSRCVCDGGFKPLLRLLLVAYLSIALVVLGFFSATPAAATFLPSHATRPDDHARDRETLRTFLESKIVRQRLIDVGLTPEQVDTRLAAWSNDEIHQLAERVELLQAGSGGLETVAILLVITLLVVLILQATGYKVILTK